MRSAHLTGWRRAPGDQPSWPSDTRSATSSPNGTLKNTPPSGVGHGQIWKHQSSRSLAVRARSPLLEVQVSRSPRPGLVSRNPSNQVAAWTRAPQTARLRVRTGAGNALRRRARVVTEVDDLWSVLEVEFTDTALLADEIAGFGPVVVALEPADLVAAVIRRLQGVLDQEGER